MERIITDRKTANRIEELFDFSMGGITAYAVRIKNIDGTIWAETIDEIYSLIHKTDEELKIIADNQ